MTTGVGQELCPCYACGKTVSAIEDESGNEGLMHEPLGEHGLVRLGSNGETGCKAFDDVSSLEDGIEYLVKCREALQAKKEKN